MTTNI